ncbi:DUF2505 domain-containing protein [Thermocrispum municipale]|uniref:DUF2505 domain-containing protein n=1 Tax=Thermocrispum municipale TaxID=37926 RepID=UPI000405D1C2|nr:DUF2505 domain-containing protein [Thermocrispum municipale]
MARPLQHSTEFSYPVDKILATIAEDAAIRARLDAIGGHEAELLSHQKRQNGYRYTLRQGIPADKLPSIVRKIHSGDLIVKREQEWVIGGDGTVTGTGGATVSGVPGSITVTTALTPRGDGAKLQVNGKVEVSIPLIGGKLEQTIAEQVVKLLRREDEFVAQQLAGAETG